MTTTKSKQSVRPSVRVNKKAPKYIIRKDPNAAKPGRSPARITKLRFSSGQAVAFVADALGTKRFSDAAHLILQSYGFLMIDSMTSQVAGAIKARIRSRVLPFLERGELPCPGCMEVAAFTDLGQANQIAIVPLCSCCESIASEE